MNWVIENSQHKGTNFVALLMIANHANAEGENSYPSMRTLAKECRTSMRSVQRAIERLEASEELQTERSPGRTTHKYSLPLMNPNVDKMSMLEEAERRQNVHVEKPQRRQRQQSNVDKIDVNVDTGDANVDKAVSTKPLEPSEPKKLEPKDPVNVLTVFGSRLSDDWEPSEVVVAWAKTEAALVDLRVALEEFKDYWTAIPGKAGRKLDWDKTFRNRLRTLQARALKDKPWVRPQSEIPRPVPQKDRTKIEAELARKIGRNYA